MTDSTSPFDDADLPQLPPEARIHHQPGMAAELMEQLAPLLAADGIDLDDLENVDLDELNAAMGRAVERHNMELNTPIGNERARTINTLREISLAQHHEKTGVVHQIFESIGRYPTQTKPSSGHLMGVVMETLDRLYGDKTLRSALGVVRLPALSATTKAAAQDIQELAVQGQAFSSLDTLLPRHGGSELTQAGAALLTATVATIAEYGRAEFKAVLDELLPGQQISEAAIKGSAFGVAAAQQTASQQYLRDFEHWLTHKEELVDDPTEIIDNFSTITADAQRAGIDLHQPEQIDALLASLAEGLDPDYVAKALDMLHYYIHFRLSTDAEPQHWYEVHAAITEITEDADDHPWDLEGILIAANDVDTEQRHQAILRLPMVTGLSDLRLWLGTSQAVTTTGAPKRADIQTVAAMIGLELQGVARLPEEPQTGYVQSALQSDELMAWWYTLEDLDIIEVTSTKVRPGPMLDEYSTPVPLDQGDTVVAAYTSHLLALQLQQSPVAAPALGYTITRLVDAMAGEVWDWDVDEDDMRSRMITAVSNGHLKRLEKAGLLRFTGNEPDVPQTLHAPLVLGLMMAIEEFGEYL